MWKRCIVIARHYGTKPIESTMKFLNVAEKNDAAKTISAHLSRGSSQRREGLSPYNKLYEFKHDVLGHHNANMVMTSVSGHLLALEFLAQYRNWKSFDPIKLFEAPVRKYCPPDFLKIKSTLEREIRGSHGLIIWTDCDREGENIGFEIIEVCRAIKPNIPVYRAKFSEITAVGVERALANLIPPDELQSKAVDVRTELDLRIGAAFTRFQTLRYQRLFPNIIESHVISYGSCQIPTLGFVAKRFKEVEAFIPQPFWKIHLSHTIDTLTVEFHWARNHLFNQQSCAALYQICRSANPLLVSVTNVQLKPKSKWRPVALDTVEMEKLGSRKLKMSAKQTLNIAEKLYTQGFISYPRTETNIFSKEMDLRSLVEHQVQHPEWGDFATKVLNWGTNPRNGKKSDQAHPPIHPIKLTTGLSGDEKKVYDLVVRHFLACVSRDATGSETTVNAEIENEEFTATGLCIHERNYLEVYTYEKWSAKEIHAYEIGQKFKPTDLSMREGRTTAPANLTEAELITLMDKHGIGTDATHAEHISKVIEREYIGKIDRGFLVPGKLGMGLVEGYEAVDLPLAEPELRAGLERDLKLICEGHKDAKLVLDEQIKIYLNAFKIISEKVTLMDQSLATRLEAGPLDTAAVAAVNEIANNPIIEVFKCPNCSQDNSVALKRLNDSYVLSCLGYPDCRNSYWLPNSYIKEISVLPDECLRCGPGYHKVKLRLKSVRFTCTLIQRNIADDGVTYITCIVCDSSLKELLDIRIERGGTTSRNQTGNQGNASIRATPAATVSRPTAIVLPCPLPATTIPRPAPAPPVYRAPAPPVPRPPRDRNAGSNTEVRCSKCNKVARKLIVKRDGPNKGKEFYACEQECNFFQWAGATAGVRPHTSNNAENNSGRANSSVAGSSGSGNGGDAGAGVARNKRKCSACRQEGHTRNKCPRLQPLNP